MDKKIRKYSFIKFLLLISVVGGMIAEILYIDENRPIFYFEYGIYGATWAAIFINAMVLFNVRRRIMVTFRSVIVSNVLLAALIFAFYKFGENQFSTYIATGYGSSILELPYIFLGIVTLVAVFMNGSLKKEVDRNDERNSFLHILFVVLIASVVFVSIQFPAWTADYDQARGESLKAYDGRLAAGTNHYMVLQDDGLVNCKGGNAYGQCETDKWSNIVKIAAGDNSSFGLKRDGTIVMAGDVDAGQDQVEGWYSITDIDACENYVVGLKKDGKLLYAGENSSLDFTLLDEMNIGKNPLKVVAGADYVAVLYQDGTVNVACNKDTYDDAAKWENVRQISAGDYHLVALTDNGKVLTAGDELCGLGTVDDIYTVDYIKAGAKSTTVFYSGGKTITLGYQPQSCKRINKMKNIKTVDSGADFVVVLYENAQGTEKTKLLTEPEK